jgi:hypothetical protein
LSFFFSLSLLLSQIVEMSALDPFSVFDQNRAHSIGFSGKCLTN